VSAATSGARPRLDFVDAFRGFAILLVVGVHAASASAVADHWLGPAILQLVFTLGVPGFFLADGYLFAIARRRDPDFAFGPFLRRSARRLLLPWLLFTILYGLAQAGAEWTGLASQPILANATPSRVLWLAYGSAFAIQLYFLLSLFLIRSLAGVWRRLALAPWPLVLAVWGGYAALEIAWLDPTLDAHVRTPGLDPITHAFWGLQFYLLGMACAAADAAIRRHAPILLAAATALAAGILALGIDAQHVFEYALRMGAFLAFLISAPLTRALRGVGRHSMGIYLLHQPVLLKVFVLAGGALVASPPLRFGLDVAGAFLAAWGASVLLSRYRTGRLILGEALEPASSRI
jgi:fucose 4-O-acetylase-like acetyltransferase